MDKTPTIHLNEGFTTDDEGRLTGMTIGSHVSTLKAPTTVNVQGDANGSLSMYASCMTTCNIPNATSIGASFFNGCTKLQTVNIGSSGHPISTIATNAFNGCTQSGLTITIYTTNGASLSGEKWGATNATIVYEEA